MGPVTTTGEEPAFRFAPQQFDAAVPVDQLAEHPRNPNQGDVGAVSLSMDDHGFYGAILAQRSTRFVIRGNHTYRTAVMKGAPAVPVFWLDVDDDEAARIMLDDNHAGRLGMDDQSLLADLLRSLAESPAGLPATYDGDDLDAILAQQEPPGEFPSFDEDIPTEHRCPSCGYTWSGSSGTAAGGGGGE
jgi:hypothetical protein